MQASLPEPTASVKFYDMQSSPTDKLETGFDHQHFYSCLPTHIDLGETLITASQLESTQTLLQENAAVVPDNTVCIAYQQVGGKGTVCCIHSCLFLFSLYSKATQRADTALQAEGVTNGSRLLDA